MINITRNKRLFARQQLKQINFLENKMYYHLNPILKLIWNETAEKIKHGDPIGMASVIVNKYSKRLKDVFVNQYKLIGDYNFRQVTNRMQEIKPKRIIDYYKKDTFNNFWYYYNIWINQQAINKVTKIDYTTKNILTNIIDKGIKDGKSYAEISKIIKDTVNFTKNRSMMIAITETHSAYNKSIFETVNNISDIKIETKEWMNAGDERVREPYITKDGREIGFDHVKANGEKVAMNESFTMTGESLDFPGDPNGSAGNVIRCRCVTLYNTEYTDIDMEE